jgi:hypothetical protein
LLLTLLCRQFSNQPSQVTVLISTGIRGITIPSKLREKGEELYGKEVIVIVILPDDE